jgi:elongation of very long chain fatty acids protein 6
LDFEKSYDCEPVFQYMRSLNYTVPVVAVVSYLLFIYFGGIVMQKYKPFKLDTLLAGWNLLLALFSGYGAVRTVPHLLHHIANKTFEETICDEAYLAYGAGACGLAVQLFCISKLPELIDTVFIVLRKKPLIFLHWYHHVTVLLYCWNSYVTESSAGLYFASMNYSVHAVMYFYFFMQAVKCVPKGFPSWIITLMQITQMIIGTGIVGACLYYYSYGGVKYAPGQCNNQVSNLVAGGLMYASYLYLFCEFAVKRFIFGVTDPQYQKALKGKSSKGESSKEESAKKVE